MKILIVDDNPSLAFLLREILEGEGFETRIATSSEEGYLSYLRFNPDWVVTDICMPVENGLEMMRRIWIHDPNAKAVYVSGDIRPFIDLIEKDRLDHKVGYLEKPFSKEDLMDLLFASRTGRMSQNSSNGVAYNSRRKERTHGQDHDFPKLSLGTSSGRVQKA